MFAKNLSKILFLGSFLAGGSMNGSCMTLSPTTELSLKNIQQRMQETLSSPEVAGINEDSIVEAAEPKFKGEFKKDLEESMGGNAGLLDYLFYKICYGNYGSGERCGSLFHNDVLRDERARYIRYLATKVFLDWGDGDTTVEQAIVALHAIVLYCKDYAEAIGLYSQKTQLNSLYAQVQHEINSSSEDEVY